MEGSWEEWQHRFYFQSSRIQAGEGNNIADVPVFNASDPPIIDLDDAILQPPPQPAPEPPAKQPAPELAAAPAAPPLPPTAVDATADAPALDPTDSADATERRSTRQCTAPVLMNYTKKG